MNKCQLLILIFLMLSSFAEAQTNANKGVTFQGVIKDTSNPSNPVFPTVTSNVIVQILGVRSDGNSCILWEESHAGVQIEKGYLYLVVGRGNKSGSPLLSFKDVFNDKPKTSLNCSNGFTDYTPLATDSRKLRVVVSSLGITADFNMRSAPMAVQAESATTAEKLNGKSDTDFINVNAPAGVTQAALEAWFGSSVMGDLVGGSYNAPTATTATNVSGVVAIANGGTGASTAAGARTNLGLGSLATMNPTGTADTTTYLRGDGTWTGLPSAPTLAGDVSGAVGTNTVDKIKGTAVNTTALADGQFLRFESGAWINGALVSADVPALDWTKIASGKPTTLAGYGITDAVKKSGDTMSGTLNMGSNDVTATGYILMSPQRAFGLGTYTNAQEATLVGGLSAAHKGYTWYNSELNQVKFWNGTAVQALGVAGSGITSLAGQTGGAQTFATGTVGTAPAWSSGSDTHTLNIPLASGAGVTAGLISNADYDAFAGKQAAGNYLTALTGDVTAAGPGSATATIAADAVTTDKIANGTILGHDLNPGGVISATSVIVMMDATGKFTNIACSTVGHVPTWTATGFSCQAPTPLLPSLADGKIWIGDGTSAATAQTMAGDATISNTGSVTVTNVRVDRLSSSGGQYLSYKPNNVSCSNNDVLKWNGTGWICGTDNAGAGTVTSVTATAPLNSSGGTAPAISLADGSADGQTLRWNGTAWIAAALSHSDVTGLGSLATKNSVDLGSAEATGTLAAARMPSLSGDITSAAGSTVTTLAATGVTAGTYSKVTVDAKGRVTTADQIDASDITIALTFTPLNKSGDVMSGPLGLNGVTADPAGLVAVDKGKVWYRTDTNEIKYWNGSAAVALGAAGAGLQSLNGLSATTQTFVTPDTATGTAPAWASSGSSHTLRIPMASASGVTAGLLSKDDYDSFSNKQSAGSYITALTGDVTASGPGSATATLADNAVTSAKIADGSIVRNDMNFAGVNTATTSFAMVDATGKFVEFACATTGHVPTWTVAGFVCQAPLGSVGTAGTYTQVTTDAQGRVTAGANPTTLSGYGITDALTNLGGTPSVQTGTFAARPAFGTAGRLYIASDNNTLYRDTGSAWVAIGDGAGLTTVNLALDVSGTLPVANGGTGATSLTNGNLLVGNGTSAVTGVAPGTTGNVLYSNGTSWNSGSATTAGLVDLASTQTVAGAKTFQAGDNTATILNALTIQRIQSDASAPAAGQGAGLGFKLEGSVDNTFIDAGKIATVWEQNQTDATTARDSALTFSTSLNATVTEKMRITSAGNVGMGILNPEAQLEVAGGIKLRNASAGRYSGGEGLIVDYLPGTGGRIMQVQGGGSTRSLSLGVGGQEKLTIASDGKVGIGTVGPGSELDVKGEIRTSGTTLGYTGFRAPASGNNITYTLPAADGSNNQVLTTNGAGILSWTTPAAGGITSLGGLTAGTQTFAIGTSGNSPAFSSATSTHTLNIPMASVSGVTAGLISKSDYDNFNGKLSATITSPLAGQHLRYNGSTWVNALVALSSDVTGTLSIANGGTGATSAGSARISLGLFSAATKDTGAVSGNVPLVGVSGITANKMCTADGTSSIICNTDIPSSQWISSASDIYFNTGKVAIGATAADRNLSVVNNSSGQGSISVQNNHSSGVSSIEFFNSGGGAEGFVGWGNSSASGVSNTVVLGSNGARTIALFTNNTKVLQAYSSGNVGIGVSGDPGVKLKVNGAIASNQVSDASPTSFDLSLGNFQHTTTGCSGASWDLQNMAEGATYTIAVQNNTHTGACNFTNSGSTFRYQPSNATPIAGHVIYSFMKVGTVIYVSWIEGFN